MKYTITSDDKVISEHVDESIGDKDKCPLAIDVVSLSHNSDI